MAVVLIDGTGNFFTPSDVVGATCRTLIIGSNRCPADPSGGGDFLKAGIFGLGRKGDWVDWGVLDEVGKVWTQKVQVVFLRELWNGQ